MADIQRVINGLEEITSYSCKEMIMNDNDVFVRGMAQEAIDSIKSQQKEIENLKGLIDTMKADVSEWISVNEKLPTYAELKEERVLVLFDNGDIQSIGFDECIEGESIFGFWRQNFDMETLGATDSDWIPVDGITHWKPCPKPPKEGAD